MTTVESTKEVECADESEVLTLRRPSSRMLLSVLVAVLIVLAMLDVVAWNSSVETGNRFSLDAETALPTWWASVQLLLLALVFGLAALRERRSGRHAAARTLVIGAVIAAFFSLDETAAIHEGITKVLIDKNLLPSFTGGHGIWIFVYGFIAIIVLVVTLTGVSSLLRTDRTNTLLVALGAATFVFGGVALEVVGYSIPSHTEVVVEEVLEFLGIAIMVWGTYRMLGTTAIRVCPNENVG